MTGVLDAIFTPQGVLALLAETVHAPLTFDVEAL
jgi:hypothetical protein